MSKKYVVMAALLVAGLLSAQALQAQILDLTKRYQVIERNDTNELFNDLSKAGQNGIRVVTGSSTGGSDVMLLLEKDPDNGRFDYVVVAADKPADIERQLGHAASQGYRLLPNTVTLLHKKFGADDVVMILEKRPESEGGYEYLLLDASLAETLQVTLAQSTEQGYKVVGMLQKKKQTLLVLEKKSS